jgi:hypothetical protein
VVLFGCHVVNSQLFFLCCELKDNYQTRGGGGALRQGCMIKAESGKKAKSRTRVLSKTTVIVLVIRGRRV